MLTLITKNEIPLIVSREDMLECQLIEHILEDYDEDIIQLDMFEAEDIAEFLDMCESTEQFCEQKKFTKIEQYVGVLRVANFLNNERVLKEITVIIANNFLDTICLLRPKIPEHIIQLIFENSEAPYLYFESGFSSKLTSEVARYMTLTPKEFDTMVNGDGEMSPALLTSIKYQMRVRDLHIKVKITDTYYVDISARTLTYLVTNLASGKRISLASELQSECHICGSTNINVKRLYIFDKKRSAGIMESRTANSIENYIISMPQYFLMSGERECQHCNAGAELICKFKNYAGSFEFSPFMKTLEADKGNLQQSEYIQEYTIKKSRTYIYFVEDNSVTAKFCKTVYDSLEQNVTPLKKILKMIPKANTTRTDIQNYTMLTEMN